MASLYARGSVLQDRGRGSRGSDLRRCGVVEERRGSLARPPLEWPRTRRGRPGNRPGEPIGWRRPGRRGTHRSRAQAASGRGCGRGRGSRGRGRRDRARGQEFGEGTVEAAVLAQAVGDAAGPPGETVRQCHALSGAAIGAAGSSTSSGSGFQGREATPSRTLLRGLSVEGGPSVIGPAATGQVQWRSEVIADAVVGQADASGASPGPHRPSGRRGASPRNMRSGMFGLAAGVRWTRRSSDSGRAGRARSRTKRVPPGPTSRAISAIDRPGSGMWWTIELLTTASNSAVGIGQTLGVDAIAAGSGRRGRPRRRCGGPGRSCARPGRSPTTRTPGSARQRAIGIRAVPVPTSSQAPPRAGPWKARGRRRIGR